MNRSDRPASGLFGPRSRESAELRAAARSGSLWTVLQQGGSRLLTVAVFLVLVRLLAPVDFGVVALATVFVALGQIVVEGGFGQALIQREDLRPGHADTAFWSSVVGACVPAGALVAAAGPLGVLFDEPRLPPVLRVLSLALVLGGLGAAHGALLRRAFRFRALAMRSVVGSLAGGVAGVTAALLGAGVWALVAQYLVLTAAQTVLLWVASGWRPGLDVSRAHGRDLFTFSRNTLGVALLTAAGQRGDDLFVGAWLGSAALGVYAVGYRLLSLLQGLIAQTIMTVSLPVFSRLQHDPERLGRVYREALRVGAAVAFPAYLFFVVAAPDVVAVFFGARWLDAAPVMRILALAGVALTVVGIAENCLVATGRPQVCVRIRLAWVVAQVVLLAVSVPYGIEWAAASVVAAALLVVPASVRALRRAGITTARQWAACLVTPFVATAVMLGAALVLATVSGPLVPAGRLAVLVVACPLVYVATLRLVDRDLLRRVWAVLGRGRPSATAGG